MPFDAGLLRLRQMLADSLTESLTLRLEAEDLRTGQEALRSELVSWQTKALALSSELTDLRTGYEALSNSLTDSLRREASTRTAAEERARLDAEALAQARGERDLWRGVAGTAGLVSLLAVIWAVAHG